MEKVLVLRQIFKEEILVDLNVLRFSNFENQIFSSWSVCVCINKITQKHYRKNKFCILHS